MAPRSLELILYKAYADLKAQAANSYLGMLWWIIEPILYLAAFYILFVFVFHRGGPDFVPNFLCGAIVWKWFDSGIKTGSNSVFSHRGLLQQVYVPKYVFPTISTLGSTAHFVPVFLIFITFLTWYGIDIQATWAAVIVIIFVQFVLILSLSMLISAVTPFLPDLQVAINNGMLMLFFLSGVFFNINDVEEPIKSYLLLNPMAGLIDEYRNVMIRGIWPDSKRLVLIFMVSIVAALAGAALLKRLDHQYGKIRF